MIRKFWRTRITIDVLSEDVPMSDDADLESVAYDIDQGDCVGKIVWADPEELTPKEMADALLDANCEPEFFGLDEDGKSTEQDLDDLEDELK